MHFVRLWRKLYNRDTGHAHKNPNDQRKKSDKVKQGWQGPLWLLLPYILICTVFAFTVGLRYGSVCRGKSEVDPFAGGLWA